MNCKQQCFGCHGFYGDGDIASQKRSSYTRHFLVGSVLSVVFLGIQASMVE